MTCRIDSNGNCITVVGSFALSDLRRMTASLHNLTTRAGYEDLLLDFSRCTAAFPGPMIGLCAQAAALRESGIDIELILPSDARIARYFTGANWAHHISPEQHGRSTYRGYTHVPASRFSDQEGQTATVNRIVDALLCSVPGIDRGDLAAIEWSINEVTDNVLVHAGSSAGGFAQINTFRAKKRVEFCVGDAGVGIPNTLRPRFPDHEDIGLLEQAIREGVTRDPSLGQGNGLFGTFQVSRTSSGYMHILSGFATLSYERDQLRITREKAPFVGTLVIGAMDASNPAALADALRFGDLKYSPTDYLETHYEDRASDAAVFRMAEETLSCGSRIAGTPVRTKLANIVNMNGSHRVVVDLTGIELVSSSFADEVFGKLFKELGPLRFMQSVEIRQVTPTVRALIDRAILQRGMA